MLKTFLKDISLYGFGDFIFKFIAFALFPIFTRLLSVEEFGVMTLLATFVSLLSVVCSIGLNNSVQRYYLDSTIKEESRPLLVSTAFFILLISSIVGTLICIIIVYFFEDSIYLHFKIYFQLFLIAIVGNIPNVLIQFCLDTLRLHFSPLQFTILSLLKNLLGAVLSISLIYFFNLQLEGYYWGALIGLIISMPVALFLIKKDLTFAFDMEYGKMMVKFGYPFIFAGLAYWLFGSLDRWMIGLWSTNYELGLYGIAFRISNVIVFVTSAFGQAWSPYAFKLYGERKDYLHLYAEIFKYYSLLLIIIGCGICLLSKEILLITTPESYWPAANSFVLIVISLVFQGTTQITAIGITLSKKTILISIGSWITVILNFILNYIFIKTIGGAIGASLATCISFLFLTIYYYFNSQKTHPIPIDKTKFIIMGLTLLLIGGISFYTNLLEWNLYILSIKIVVLIVVLLTFFFLFNISNIKNNLIASFK